MFLTSYKNVIYTCNGGGVNIFWQNKFRVTWYAFFEKVIAGVGALFTRQNAKSPPPHRQKIMNGPLEKHMIVYKYCLTCFIHKVMSREDFRTICTILYSKQSLIYSSDMWTPIKGLNMTYLPTQREDTIDEF